MPFFSIVIPLYNKANFIAETLASIAAQDFTDYEVIVVDDGSHDDGPARAEAMGLPTLRLVRQVNGGPGIARNRGIAEARGAWVAFLDADDLWLPDHLSTLAHTIATSGICGIVATGFMRSGPAELPAALNASRKPGIVRRAEFLSDSGRVCTSCVAVERGIAANSDGFGAAWPGEDVEYWFRLSRDHPLAINDRVTAVYRQQTGGAMDAGAGTPPSTDTILDHPILQSIARTLDGIAPGAESRRIERYRRDLLIEYIRPSLFNGHDRLARAYIRQLRAFGGRAPFHYTLLSRLPGGLVRSILHRYSGVKARLRR